MQPSECIGKCGFMRSTHIKIGDAQERLANRVHGVLGRVEAKFLERVIEHRVDATIAFKLEVRQPSRLTAAIDIGADGFWFKANGAALHLEMQDAGNDPEAWIELCVETLDAILTHPLRIRTRRTFLPGRRVGAVWVPGDLGVWNGEYFAWRGWGREECFDDWLGSPTG